MVVVAVPKETLPGEERVALTPETAGKLVASGMRVVVETGAGRGASCPDEAYVAAGASVVDRAPLLSEAEILLVVRAPPVGDIAALSAGVSVVGLLDPHRNGEALAAMAACGASAYAMELIPRITRAQVMDALSSQANLAGYRAVIEAAAAYGRALPMMTTAAGTIRPAKVFVMGAGVAGLQAIATARRLGASVTATDVRPAAKEQVESLGARFVAVEDDEFRAAETAGGYAKAMSAEYQAKQQALVSEHIAGQDIVITTALIPGRPAPRLVSAAQIAAMRAGSVVVDLAVEQGGNVEGALADQAVVAPHGVSILGFSNLPARVAADASALYSRNLEAFVRHLTGVEPEAAQADEILGPARVVADGKVLLAPALVPAT